MTDTAPVILVGAGRSGTNLLRDLACSLPGYTTWPCDEINYIWRHGNRDAPTDELAVADARPAVRRYVRAKFDRQRRRASGESLVEKTCATTLRVGFAHHIFPEARFVVIVRDGRDVAVSAATRWTARPAFRYLARKARFVPPGDALHYAMRYARSRVGRRRNPDGRLATWGPRFAGIDDAVRNLSLIELCALQWMRCVDTADAQLEQYVDPAAVHRVRYESLAESPQAEIARLATFLGVAAPMPDHVRVVNAAGVGHWRGALSGSQREGVEDIAGSTLSRLGYLQ